MLRISCASSWFSLHDYIKMHGQQNIKKKVIKFACHHVIIGNSANSTLPKLDPKCTNPRYQLAQVTEHCLVVPHICGFSV